ncbi:MAG: carbohydrate binding domain-containing protein [Elusimicrobiota bacterium]
MKKTWLVVLTLGLFIAVPGARAAIIVDDFEDISDWNGYTSLGTTGTITLDSDAVQGTYSMKCNFTSEKDSYKFVAKNWNHISSQDWSGYTKLVFWLKVKSYTDNTWQLQLEYGSNAGGQGTSYWLNPYAGSPYAVDAWVRIILPLKDTDVRTGIDYVKVQTYGTGWGEVSINEMFDVYFDDMKVMTDAELMAYVSTPSFKISSDTGVIRPGSSVNYTVVFSTAMDTSAAPVFEITLPSRSAASGSKITVNGAWLDALTCRLNYSFSASVPEGYGQITLTNAVSGLGYAITDCSVEFMVAKDSLVPDNKLEFFPNPFSPNGDGFADKTTLFVKTAKSSSVQVTIYDLRGTIIRDLYRDTVNGNCKIDWDGKDNSGDTAKIGLYIYQIEIDNSITSGSVVLTK